VAIIAQKKECAEIASHGHFILECYNLGRNQGYTPGPAFSVYGSHQMKNNQLKSTKVTPQGQLFQYAWVHNAKQRARPARRG